MGSRKVGFQVIGKNESPLGRNKAKEFCCNESTLENTIRWGKLGKQRLKSGDVISKTPLSV